MFVGIWSLSSMRHLICFIKKKKKKIQRWCSFILAMLNIFFKKSNPKQLDNIYIYIYRRKVECLKDIGLENIFKNFLWNLTFHKSDIKTF